MNLQDVITTADTIAVGVAPTTKRSKKSAAVVGVGGASAIGVVVTLLYYLLTCHSAAATTSAAVVASHDSRLQALEIKLINVTTSLDNVSSKQDTMITTLGRIEGFISAFRER